MRRAPLVAALLVAAGLAGCLGEAPVADGTVTVNETGGGDVAAKAPDGRDIAAFQETNRTEAGLGGRAHEHDYWKGRDRVLVGDFQAWLIPFPLTPADGNGKQYTPGTAIADFQPEPPSLVYEGTAHVEVVMNRVWVGGQRTVDHPYAHFNFQYLTSKDGPGEWREGGKLEIGKPVIVPVAADEVDMPHATGSLWVFRFYTDEPNSVVFNATVTAVRGAEVARWPGHPDFYADKRSRVVFDGNAQTKSYGFAKYMVTGEDTSWNHPDKLVSYGTRELHVFVNLSRVEGVQTPTRFYLDFHNATVVPGIGDFDPSQTRIYDEATDGTSYHFVVPVDEGGMDAPYQPKSRWGFRVLGEFGDEKNCFGLASSCTEYTVDYHMTVVAVGESAALGVEGEAAAEGGGP